MNTNRYILAALSGAVFLFFYGFVVNMFVLNGFYTANTPSVIYRTGGEPLMWAICLSMILQGFVLAYIFVQHYESKGIGEGVRFGLLVGLLLASTGLITYAIQPIPFSVYCVSAIADAVGFIGAGIVFALVYKPAS